MSTGATRAPETDPIMERLEDQIGWYDRKNMTNQRYFRRIKIIEIAAAALIPFLSAFSYSRMILVTGGLGVVITVLEGMSHLALQRHQEIPEARAPTQEPSSRPSPPRQSPSNGWLLSVVRFVGKKFSYVGYLAPT